MVFALSHTELQIVSYISELDLVDLAVELDYVPEAQIDRSQLLGNLIPRLVALAEKEGLPFSKYDLDDLEDLPDTHRSALAMRMGWNATPAAMLRKGERVYRSYRNSRRNSQVAQLLPTLLPIVARCAHELRVA
ncbi:MAG: hypothetical protein ACI9VR_002721 [Cognaticolwellia sp.]